MTWILIASGAYFLGAIANILDKFLLGSKRISSAVVYAFYVGIFSLAAFMFAPFGLKIPAADFLLLCLVGGALFLLGILLLYFAIERAQASRVVPVIGAVIPIVTFAIAAATGMERLPAMGVAGVFLLIIGGLLISFDLPFKIGKKKFFAGFPFALWAGVFLALSYIVFKYVSAHENFITWYVWTRVGGALAVGLFFLVPSWRSSILKSFTHVKAKKNRRKAFSTGSIFVANKIVGGASTLMLNYAIALGSVTLLNAMVSLQYVFVFILAVALSHRNKKIFEENLYFWDWAQKIMAIAIIGAGVFLISNIQ
ncbi:MAG TPA: hypothetical protein VF817_04045 [Patescibacteria group bacterium]